MSDETGPWERTLSELNALAEDRKAEGWAVCAFPAGATGFQTRADSDDDHFGAVFVVPGDVAEELSEIHDRGEFPRYQVYGRTVSGRRFIVLRFDDPEAETCVLVAASFPLEDARQLLPAIRETGVVYARFRTLDGSHLATFELSDPDLLIPDAAE